MAQCFLFKLQETVFSDRLTHIFHEFQQEAEIVDRQQTAAVTFVAAEQMVQIGLCVFSLTTSLYRA